MLWLPSRKQEAWRWSDLSALRAIAATPVERRALKIAPLWIGTGPRLLFVNGDYWSEQSEPGPVTIGPVEATSAHPLGTLCEGAGWTIGFGAGAALDQTIEIIHLSTGGANHVPAALSIAEGMHVSLCETFVGDGWANRLSVISLAPSAKLDRVVRLMQTSGFTSVRDEIAIGRDARMTSHAIGLGGAGTRIDAAISLVGERSHVEYGGALLANDEQTQEAAVTIDHLAPGGCSRQTWRAIAMGRATVSVAAQAQIATGAQHSDVAQNLRGMLVSPEAAINLKPELVIYADDIKAAHGATIGALDDEALHYLAARGIPPQESRQLLMKSFVAQAFEGIASHDMQASVETSTLRWLETALD